MEPALQRTPAANRVHYERRRPEETILYQLVQENLESFLGRSKPRVEAACRSLSKPSSMPSSPAAFSRTGFFACAVASAPTSSWSPSHASGAAFAPLAARGAWRKPPPHLVDCVIPPVPVRQ